MLFRKTGLLEGFGGAVLHEGGLRLPMRDLVACLVTAGGEIHRRVILVGSSLAAMKALQFGSRDWEFCPSAESVDPSEEFTYSKVLAQSASAWLWFVRLAGMCTWETD
jgi:hypothetical protein